MLQRVIPLGRLSRAFGVLEGSFVAAEPSASAAGAILIAWLGVGWVPGCWQPAHDHRCFLSTGDALRAADVGVSGPDRTPSHVEVDIHVRRLSGTAELERLPGTSC